MYYIMYYFPLHDKLDITVNQDPTCMSFVKNREGGMNDRREIEIFHFVKWADFIKSSLCIYLYISRSFCITTFVNQRIHDCYQTDAHSP